ncbi:MAG: hypothetical protein WBQ24_14230 [Xanthobacteraceae bacterium]
MLDAILALRANTAESIKLQIRAVSIAASDQWDADPPGNTAEKNFIESAAAFFGMDAKGAGLRRAAESHRPC